MKIAARCAYGAIVLFLAVCFSGTVLAQKQPSDCENLSQIERNSGTFRFTLDNDMFANRDQDYTNGVKFAWTSPNVRDFANDECLPPWLQNMGQMFTKVYSPTVEQGNVSVTFGQAMFTPRDKLATELVVNDRPYAGWTYFGLGYNTRSEHRLDAYEINLGMVGPWAHARESQNFIHKLINSPLAYGWSNQLGNEFGVQVVFERKYRLPLFGNRRGWSADLIPHFGASLGNVATYANAGFETRFGWGLPDDFGTSPIRPAGDNSSPRVGVGLDGADRYMGLHFFASVNGRAVARNIFLDGNTFRDSHSVRKKHWVGDAAIGFAVNMGRYKLAFARIFRSQEFHGQLSNPSYGSATLSIPF